MLCLYFKWEVIFIDYRIKSTKQCEASNRDGLVWRWVSYPEIKQTQNKKLVQAQIANKGGEINKGIDFFVLVIIHNKYVLTFNYCDLSKKSIPLT